MNWSDIERALDLEFTRLESERINQMEQDEKLADFLVRKFKESLQDSERLNSITVSTTQKSTYEEMLEEDPEGMVQAEKELDNELKWIEKRRELDRKLLTIVKGSSVTEFKQNWEEKVEAS